MPSQAASECVCIAEIRTPKSKTDDLKKESAPESALCHFDVLDYSCVPQTIGEILFKKRFQRSADCQPLNCE